MAPVKLAALFLSLGSVAAAADDSETACSPKPAEDTADVVEAINLLRTGKINNPMPQIDAIQEYQAQKKMANFIKESDCTLETGPPKKGFFTEVEETDLDYKGYLKVLNEQLGSLDELMTLVTRQDEYDKNGYDDQTVSNLAFLVSSEVKEAGCAVVSGCKGKSYLFCTFTAKDGAGEEEAQDITGAPKVTPEFLQSLAERKAAGIEITSLDEGDMDTRLPTSTENPATPGSGASITAVSSVLMAATALSSLLL